jgi:hypothetical protein
VYVNRGYAKTMDVLDELDGVLCRLELDIGCNESYDVSDDEENKVIIFQLFKCYTICNI